MTNNIHTVESFDPVDAFEQAINDLILLTENFAADDSAVTPGEYLQGVTSISERIRAVALVTLTGAMALVADKIPTDVRDQHEAKRDFDALMSTPEDERKRLMKAIRSIHLG